MADRLKRKPMRKPKVIKLSWEGYYKWRNIKPKYVVNHSLWDGFIIPDIDITDLFSGEPNPVQIKEKAREVINIFNARQA